ncbi:6-hydroxynicotinate 3-monooxygenase [Escovopsis weberi]|uniref:6-hydroxynicotinate 3-monooxygenase n=1 Tax=Escovopsis weberi TaxID=150374 RepID=A0A0M8N0P8_ESCWE|nr:6-hydroxynicotinate 3-monooxygenase [Escovopsis weberi]
MKIIIVGGGLGGLTAAFRLSKSGHDVRLLERAPQIKARGGGISIRASAARLMQSWGLGEELNKVCDRSASVSYRDLHSGAEINTIHDHPDNRDWGASRRIMMDVLARSAAAAGAQLVLGTAVASVTEADDGASARITLASGDEMTADLVILADGISSRLRGLVLADLGPAEQFQPVADDVTLYNFEVPMPVLCAGDAPGAAPRVVASDSNVTFWVGDRTQDGYVMSRFSRQADEVRLLFAIHEKTDQATLWDESGDVDLVRRSFAAAYADLADVLRHSEFCARWKIAEAPNLPRWHGRLGRVALLGDCAHGMHPSAGQGFATIVEDIGVLDHVLSPADAAGVPRALRAWQAVCKPRAERIKAFARAMTFGISGRAGVGIKAFAAKTAKVPEGVTVDQIVPDKDAPFDSLAFFKWNSAYDCIKEVETYLAQHPEGI